MRAQEADGPNGTTSLSRVQFSTVGPADGPSTMGFEGDGSAHPQLSHWCGELEDSESGTVMAQVERESVLPDSVSGMSSTQKVLFHADLAPARYEYIRRRW